MFPGRWCCRKRDMGRGLQAWPGNVAIGYSNVGDLIFWEPSSEGDTALACGHGPALGGPDHKPPPGTPN